MIYFCYYESQNIFFSAASKMLYHKKILYYTLTRKNNGLVLFFQISRKYCSAQNCPESVYSVHGCRASFSASPLTPFLKVGDGDGSVWRGGRGVNMNQDKRYRTAGLQLLVVGQVKTIFLRFPKHFYCRPL